MKTDAILNHFEGVTGGRHGRWMALCPAHDDNSPSLSIREDERGITVNCFAGCSQKEILAGAGLKAWMLFSDAPIPRTNGNGNGTTGGEGHPSGSYLCHSDDCKPQVNNPYLDTLIRLNARLERNPDLVDDPMLESMFPSQGL